MGTRRKGIGILDGENCVVYHTGNSGLPHDQWNSEIAIDPEGNIWIGSLRFLSIFDGNNWSVFEIESPLSTFSKISDIEFDRDGNAWIAWIGAMWGLGKIDELELIECSEVKSAVNAIAIDKNDYPWFGTDGEGLIKFDQDQINITKFDTSNSNIPDNTIFSMKYDSKENLWLTTYKGLACFDGTNFKVYNTDNSDLPENSVFSIEIDAQDNIWLGLFHKGLMKFDGTNWKKYDLINSGIVNNHVTSIASDVNSNTWISCHSVLSQFDGINWTLYDQTNFEILDSYFNRVYDDRSRAIWTGSDLLISFYKDKNYWGAYNINNLHKGNHAKIDKEGNIWLSGNEGLCKFDGQNWTIFNKDNSPLPSNAIRELAIDDNNNLWLSTVPVSLNESGLLMKYDGVNWETYYTCHQLRHWISGLEIDQSGNIWIGIMDRSRVGIEYGGGLKKFDSKNWISYDIYNSDLPSNSVVDIAFDDDENLWIGTYAGGLAKFDCKDEWTLYNTRNSGLPGNNVEIIEINEMDNKWLGVQYSGLTVFREGGVILTDINENHNNPIPTTFSLSQNYPNPFNPGTNITFSIPEKSFVNINIYNLMGQLVKNLSNQTYRPGTYSLRWNGRDNFNNPVPSGVYLYVLKMDEKTIPQKMILLK
jgi:ligand-binding sensor domain-containing protein